MFRTVPPSPLLFAQTADRATSGTAEITMLGTGIGTLTLPANTLGIGKTLRLRGVGTLTTVAAPGTVTLKIKLGAVVIALSAAITPTASKTNVGFDFEILLTCRTVGVTGTVMGSGSLCYDTGAVIPLTATAAVTVDTTAAQVLDLTSTNSIGAGCVFTTRSATLETLS